MRFRKQFHAFIRTAHRYIGRSLVDLLELIHSHSTAYRLSNRQLAQEMACSIRTISRLIRNAIDLGLVYCTQKVLAFHGHQRHLVLSDSCVQWMQSGDVPESLKLGSKKYNRIDTSDYHRVDTFGIPIEEKKREKQESKQARKGALLASLSSEKKFPLIAKDEENPKPSEKPAIQRSLHQVGDCRGKASKSRGEPVKGLPEAFTDTQAKADGLWNAIDSANLGLRSTVRLYTLAQEKQCTVSQFKAILEKALQRKPWNLGGLLHTMLSEDAEIYLREAQQQHQRLSRDALDANLRVLCEWISNAPSAFKNGEAVRDQGIYILPTGRTIDYSGTNMDFQSVMHQLQAEANQMRRQAR